MSSQLNDSQGKASQVFKGPGSGARVTRSSSKRLKKLLRRQGSLDLFTEHDERVPAIGGCVDLTFDHSPHLLPPEVVLFDPSPREVWQGGVVNQPGKLPGTRFIFLNTPLEACEVDSLAALHQLLRETRGADGEFPHFIHLHALRILQYRHFDVQRAAELLLIHLQERVQRLPIAESEVLQDLKSGFMYWHGRDKSCRPCLVLRIERLQDFKTDKERAVRLVLFVLEYGIRFAMVPGRVENLVVIMDLQNASSVVSLWQLPSIAATAKAIAVALEQVYCGRMVWLKIINMPTFLSRIVSSLIPSEKKKKIQVVMDAVSELQPLFMPNQLERRYGGEAPDVEASEVYPFRFFPNCTGTAVASSGPSSLHASASREFHEGHLWDDSTPENTRRWLEPAQKMSLTTLAAEALSKRVDQEIRPCQDLETWHQLVEVLEDETATSKYQTEAEEGLDKLENTDPRPPRLPPGLISL